MVESGHTCLTVGVLLGRRGFEPQLCTTALSEKQTSLGATAVTT